jgi:predicted Zn-dependent peptidase
MLDVEDSSRVANMMVERAFFWGEVEPLKTIVERYKKVNLTQVKRLAQKLINFEAMNLAIIGPYEQNEFDELIG